MSQLHVGQRARVISPEFESCGKTGTIYNYLPSRPWPWHWLPDGAQPGTGAGIAFTEDELEPIEEGEEVKPS